VSAVVRLSTRLATGTAAGTGASFDDSGNSNRILAIVGILVALGLALLIFSLWFWRSTRPEPEALAPLELLGSRKLRRAAPEARRRALDQVRPVVAGTGHLGDAVHAAPPEQFDLAALAARDLPPLSLFADDPPPAPVGPPIDQEAEVVVASSVVGPPSAGEASPSAEAVFRSTDEVAGDAESVETS